MVQVFSHLTESGAPIRSLIAAAQEDAAFREVFKEKFIRPREKMVTDLLKRAQDQGEIGQLRDAKMLSIFVHGAFWYALLSGDPVDGKLATEIVAEVFRSEPR
ncbi:TetR-like C-terminal domain-containing protein [Rhodobacteraceae bacterium KMM 6894]|nr:TetR-like C-terminal domain-containing protein [Rhodobacteraceae bacterium KMM 6894]